MGGGILSVRPKNELPDFVLPAVSIIFARKVEDYEHRIRKIQQTEGREAGGFRYVSRR